MSSNPDASIPAHQPMLSTGGDVGKGWMALGTGALIKSSDQYYAFHTTPPGWRLSTFVTSDGFVNSGRQTYRRPVSLRACLGSIPGVLTKHWRRRFPKPITHS